MIAALLAAAAVAQATPAVRTELAPLAFLVGHCWRGEFANSGERDVHCFEPVFGGQHVRDRHEVTGGASVYRGETIYSWNAADARVEYSYWSSTGGVSRGTMVPGQARLNFGDETYTGRDGRRITLSTHWRIVDADTFEMVTTSSASASGNRVVRYRRVTPSAN